MVTNVKVGPVLIPEHVETRKVYGVHKGSDGKLHGRINAGRHFGHYVWDPKRKVWVEEDGHNEQGGRRKRSNRRGR